MTHRKLILVGGPTASGKSAFALDLAQKEHGVIINADAMQVYEGLPLLTAQPSVADHAVVPHRLYGAFNPALRSSAGNWVEQAQAAIRETIDAGCIPLLVGGTGLYLRALLGGLDDMPAIPDSVRNATQTLYDELGEAAFRRRLAERDPESAARLAQNDRQRLIRAYEVAAHTGKPLAAWHRPKNLDSDSYRIPDTNIVLPVEKYLILPPREEIYAACDARFLKMIERGAVDEVKAFLTRGLDPDLPAMKTIGVREIGAWLSGEVTRESAISKAQQLTRNYAKRQMTWFRNQWKGVRLSSRVGESFGKSD